MLESASDPGPVMSDYTATNLAYWNEMARRRVDSPGYSTAAFRRGENILDPVVLQGVGEVRGKKLLHLQCHHFGLDTLSLARMGADVTGLDFSGDAIAIARQIASETGVKGTFIQSNVLTPPVELNGFDIVFASWGGDLLDPRHARLDAHRLECAQAGRPAVHGRSPSLSDDPR
jgi:2-polyprenyl-3-methyl-5-hydroxy-6-metoxy-1,4-benzoquinol methylase